MRLKIWRKLGTAPESAAPGLGFENDITRLYEREAPRIHRRLARRFTPDKAADLVQTAFMHMLRLGADRFGAIVHPRAYLYRVADNLANDHGRTGEHRLEMPVEAEVESDDDLHAVLETRDLLRRIEAAIPLLPDRTREVFLAHRFENLTYCEIAERMGISIKTVEYHISSALRALHRAAGDRP